MQTSWRGGWLRAPWWGCSAEANGLLKRKPEAFCKPLLPTGLDRGPFEPVPGLVILQGCAVLVLGGGQPSPTIYLSLAVAGPGASSAEGLRSESLTLPASPQGPTLRMIYSTCWPITGLWALVLPPSHWPSTPFPP